MRKQNDNQNARNYPKVTVITTTFNLIKNNRKDYIDRNIKSVHNQTYKNIEHIIIDGASTDGTVELLEKYSKKGWITYYSEKDFGIYDAMNKSLKYASGKYINFLNSDDYFYDNKAVEKSINKLENSDADYSYGNACILDNGFDTLWIGNESNLITGTQYNHQTMFLKTNILKELDGFDTTYKISADSDLEIKLVKNKYKSVYVDAIISGYQSGGASGQQVEIVRKEHSSSYYKNIGKFYNLTEQDCYNLWQFRFMEELPLNKQLELLSKIPEELGLINIFEDYARRNYKKERPTKIKKYIKIFNLIPILKITSNNKCKKYYLFTFIPILKKRKK